MSVLSIRQSTLEELEFGAFVFEVNGYAYLRGTLNECMESRHGYAEVLDRANRPYEYTELPTVHKDNLVDFFANPVMGELI